MSIIKRISATLFSRIDDAVTCIEDHDAVVEAAIRDARHAAAQARVRLARVRADGSRLRARLAELNRDAALWTERARSRAEQDEDAALECLRRRRDCERQAGEVRDAVSRHEDLESRLTRDISSAEERVRDVSRQRNLMRSRQSVAEALERVSRMSSTQLSDVQDAFERWEVQVTEAELNTSPDHDSLERECLDTEQRASLKAELADLMNKEEK